MGLVDQLDFEPLLEAYLFANTPRYLYKHFRGNTSLDELVNYHSTDTLVDEYDAHTTKEERTVEDVVLAYAILIAFTFLEYQQALTALKRLDLSRLDWGQEIKDIFVSTAKMVNFFKINTQPSVGDLHHVWLKRPEELRSSSSSRKFQFELPHTKAQ